MLKINKKDTRTMSLASFLSFYCCLWTYFTLFIAFLPSIDFEQVNVSWDDLWLMQPQVVFYLRKFYETQVHVVVVIKGIVDMRVQIQQFKIVLT